MDPIATSDDNPRDPLRTDAASQSTQYPPVENATAGGEQSEQQQARERPAPRGSSAVSTAPAGEVPTPKHGWVMPEAVLDPDDPAAMYVTPTVAKVSAPVMRRFNAARRGAPSHTAIVLDAMFEHAQELDQLILKHRPEIAARYSRRRLPLRRLTAEKQKEKKDDLRIRPTEAELNYLKLLVDSINAWLEQNWPKTKPTDQSEVLTVLLDAHLPPARSKKDAAAS